MQTGYDTERLEELLKKFAAEERWARLRDDEASCVYQRTIIYETTVMSVNVSIVRNQQAVLSCAPMHYFLGETEELQALVERINLRLDGAECEIEDDNAPIFHFAVDIAAEKNIGLEELFEGLQTACLEVAHKYFCAAMLVYWGKETITAALEEVDQQDA